MKNLLCNLFNNKSIKDIKSIFFVFLLGIILLFDLTSTAKNVLYKDDFDFKKFNSNFQNYNHKITIVNDSNQNIIEFNVAIADSEEKQKYGLMNLEFLPQNLGMLFIKDSSQNINMWMKNTKIPLDMIFFDKNNLINHIEKNTIPESLKIISSQQNSIAVLEINAGIAEKYNLKIGNKLIIYN